MHGDDQRIPLACADHRQADAGIAGGAFDHGHAGCEAARTLGRLDDIDRQPVLDRAAGIEGFRFDVERDVIGGDADPIRITGVSPIVSRTVS